MEKNSGSDNFLIQICFLFWFGYVFLISLRPYWFGYWSLCWIRIIQDAYINLRGWPVEGVLRIQENFRFSPMRVMRERSSYNSCIFFSISNQDLSSPPMNVGTLSNHVKSSVFFIMWLFSINYLLVVDLLRFRFRCRFFNSVFFYCLIGDRSTFSSLMGSFKILPNSFCTSEVHNFMEFTTSQTINDTTNSLRI